MNKRNRIIVLIDFSEYSENLVDFAFNISEIIDAKIVFAHHVSVVAPGMADQAARDEIAKAESEEAYENLRKLARGRIYSEDSFHVSQMPVRSILKELTNEHYFDWVFVGLKGTGMLKRLFIGSTAISIVDESDLLTVAVPIRTPLPVPQKILVGVHPKYPLNKHQFSKVLAALKDQIKKLEFFTILKDGEDEATAKAYLSGLQTEYQAHGPGIYLYKGNYAFDLLKERVVLTENAFLVLQKGSRSLSDKLFRTFMINELVYSGHTPLIVLSK